MQNTKTKLKRKLQHFKLILQCIFTHRSELLASLSHSFEEGKYICPDRCSDWLAKISEITEFEGPAICGIKLPHHCLAQEILFLHLQYAAARLRFLTWNVRNMISNMDF